MKSIFEKLLIIFYSVKTINKDKGITVGIKKIEENPEFLKNSLNINLQITL